LRRGEVFVLLKNKKEEGEHRVNLGGVQVNLEIK